MNKWILLLAILLVGQNAVAVEQYYQSQCDRIKAEREGIRKRMNRSYTAEQGERWNKRSDELFTLLAKYCKNPKRTSGNGGTHTYQSSSTALLNTKVHNSTVYSNSFNDDKKRIAWGQFYQLPERCRAKKIEQADFVWCSENKSEQKALFESIWDAKPKSDYKDVVITVKPTITEINSPQSAVKTTEESTPIIQHGVNAVTPQLDKMSETKIWQLIGVGFAALLFVFGFYRWFKD